VGTGLALSTRSWYNTNTFNKLRVMYDDYEIDFDSHANDCNLDEDSYYENHTRDLQEDDDYARDAQDYESLAYRHYA